MSEVKAEMSRVFISYCRSDRQLIRKVAADLESAGHQVWWDTQLISGNAFRDVIDRELDAADAVIVIWTPSSIRSSWVVAEADHAMRLGKLIPMAAEGIEAWQIPKPYGTLHAGLATDQEQVLSAVQGLLDGSMVPSLSASHAAPLSRDTGLKAVRAESQMSTILLLTTILIAISSVLGAYWFRAGASDKVVLLFAICSAGILTFALVAIERSWRTRNPMYEGLKAFNWLIIAIYGWGAASLITANWPALQKYQITLSVCAAAITITVIVLVAQVRGAAWVLTAARALAAVQIVALGAHVARQTSWATVRPGWFSSHPEAFLHVLYVATGIVAILISILFLVSSLLLNSRTHRRA